MKRAWAVSAARSPGTHVRLERLDELLRVDGRGLGRLAALKSQRGQRGQTHGHGSLVGVVRLDLGLAGRRATGEEARVGRVELEQLLRDRAALRLVGRQEDVRLADALLDEVELPGEAVHVEHANVHAARVSEVRPTRDAPLTGLGAVRVRRVAAEEDLVIERVVGRDALADLIDGEPVDVAKLELERREDGLGALDADVLRRLGSLDRDGLAGRVVRLELDVEADEAVLARDDHDRALAAAVDQALVVEIGEVGCAGHTRPCEADALLICASMTPQTMSVPSPCIVILPFHSPSPGSPPATQRRTIDRAPSLPSR